MFVTSSCDRTSVRASVGQGRAHVAGAGFRERGRNTRTRATARALADLQPLEDLRGELGDERIGAIGLLLLSSWLLGARAKRCLLAVVLALLFRLVVPFILGLGHDEKE